MLSISNKHKSRENPLSELSEKMTYSMMNNRRIKMQEIEKANIGFLKRLESVTSSINSSERKAHKLTATELKNHRGIMNDLIKNSQHSFQYIHVNNKFVKPSALKKKSQVGKSAEFHSPNDTSNCHIKI